jgi:hypothetical protein
MRCSEPLFNQSLQITAVQLPMAQRRSNVIWYAAGRRRDENRERMVIVIYSLTSRLCHEGIGRQARQVLCLQLTVRSFVVVIIPSFPSLAISNFQESSRYLYTCRFRTVVGTCRHSLTGRMIFC